MSNTRIVVYTAIFGAKDRLLTPLFIPPGVDFVCFTDQQISSKVWQVKKTARPLPDATRSARMYKLLPHQFLQEYDIALWVDGNILIKGDIRELIDTYLTDTNLAVYDMSQQKVESRDCIYDELEQLRRLNQQGKFQDEMSVMESQIEGYRKEGYPAHNGLAWTCVLLRKHKTHDVVAFDIKWWEELSSKSKRDQLSFNYAAWKTGLKWNYVKGDATEDAYVKRLSHKVPWRRQPKNYALGALKRLKRIFTLQ